VINLKEESVKLLKQIYGNIKVELIKVRKKLLLDSVLISFIDISSNNRYKILRKSAIKKSSIPAEILVELETRNCVQDTDTVDKITITSKGMWIVEDEILSLENALPEYFEYKFFSVFEKSIKPLKDQDKVLLLSMIGMRTFSEKSSIDLDKHDNKKWKSIFDKCADFGNKMGLISSKKEDLIKERGNETAASYIIRRANDLPKKTRGIYVYHSSRRRYYLNITDNNRIIRDKFVYLLRQLFKGVSLTHAQLLEIESFLKNLSYNNSLYLFSTKEHVFTKPEYDDIIKEVLMEI